MSDIDCTREIDQSPAQTSRVGEALALRARGLRSVRIERAGQPAFDLYYTRTGPRTDTPVVVLPGGPGLASVLPYRGLRKRATERGIDLLMIEHRGIGLSRTDYAGTDLPVEAITIRDVIDDIAAVLDDAGVASASIYGSSYGSYLAAGFGATFPQRVAGMVLDSPVLSAQDYHVVRDYARALLWNGADRATARSAELLRRLVAERIADLDTATDIARKVYEFSGPQLLERVLTQALAGSADWTWQLLDNAGRNEISDVAARYWMEFGQVGQIAFTELNFAHELDGGPFGSTTQFTELARRYRPFAGEPFDLPARMPEFRWPTVVISGSRDLRTPPPIAERVHQLIPDSVLLGIDNGHSALDTHQAVTLHVLDRLHAGQLDRLRADDQFVAGLRRSGSPVRLLPRLIQGGLAADRARVAVRRWGRN